MISEVSSITQLYHVPVPSRVITNSIRPLLVLSDELISCPGDAYSKSERKIAQLSVVEAKEAGKIESLARSNSLA